MILGLFIAFAGSASAEDATVNATIEGTVEITLSTADGDSHCNLTDATVTLKPGDTGATDGAADDVLDDYITIENSGTLFVDIAAYTGSAKFFTGGSIVAPKNQYVQAVDNTSESGSMKTNDTSGYAELSNVSTAGSRTSICQGLDWDNATDSIFIHIQLNVPADASTETYSNTITVVAAEDTGANNQANTAA